MYGGNVYRANTDGVAYDKKLHPTMKKSGQESFNLFKNICNEINDSIDNKKILTYNSWQNSGTMYNYFWCQFKNESRKKSASSISLFAYKDYFQLVIEWDSKKANESTNTLEEHNSYTKKLKEWISKNSIDTKLYSIQILDKECTLDEYMNKSEIVYTNNNNWIRVGKKYTENNTKVLINHLIEMINNLDWLYSYTYTNDEVIEGIVDKENEIEKKVEITIKENNSMSISRLEISNQIQKYITSKGFIYNNKDLNNFYLSLKTKPFVILAGISGTGKSKLVKLFANAIGATSENGQYNIISVKPDWNDSTELFGYKNINDEFVAGKLTESIKQASSPENINKPYFICLDEMNLARVEYYLSEYLSIIESRDFKGDEIVTNKLFKDDYLDKTNEYCNLIIPENIYIIGTVNMDDTTFAFSRKVLDRANTIEFSDVDLDILDFEEEECDPIEIDNNFLKTSFLNIKEALAYDKEFVKQINKKIIEINGILKKGNKNFGYRVRDEIVFYMLENKISGLLDEDIAFDYQIMQKILPTISGSESYIKQILIELFKVCLKDKKDLASTADVNDCEKIIEFDKAKKDEEFKKIKYKKSAEKILMMLRGYEDGFTSFWV